MQFIAKIPISSQNFACRFLIEIWRFFCFVGFTFKLHLLHFDFPFIILSFYRRLEQNFITEITPKAFANFKRLRRIDLSNNNISRIAHDAFTGLKSLTTL